MNGSQEEVDYEGYAGSEYCWQCGGTGTIITCCDDLCRASDHCMHGDGEEICDICHGDG